MFGLHHHTGAVGLLGGQRQQHRLAVRGVPSGLRGVLGGDGGGQVIAGPDLPVRMRVGAAHHRALVLEYLHIGVSLAQIGGLCHPCGDDAFYGGQGQFGQALAVVGREADDACLPARGGGLQQACGGLGRGRIGAERRKIIGEDVGAFIRRVRLAGHAGVAGAEVARRIMRGALRGVGRVLLPLPRALGAVRGYQQPFVRQRVVAAVRVVGRIKGHNVHFREGGGAYARKAHECCAAPSPSSRHTIAEAIRRHGVPLGEA